MGFIERIKKHIGPKEKELLSGLTKETLTITGKGTLTKFSDDFKKLATEDYWKLGKSIDWWKRK